MVKVILHTLGWLGRGGVEQRRVLLAEEQVESEIRHVLICQVYRPALANRLRNAGWNVYEVGLARNAFDLGWYQRAFSIAKAVQPDLIHGAVSEGNLLATVLGILLRKPKVIIEETSDFRGRRWSGDFLFWLMAAKAHFVVGVAPEIGTLLRRKLGILAHKVKVINNGVAPHPIAGAKRLKAIRENYGIRRGDLVLGSVGRLLDSHKRFSDVIRVSARLSSRFPNLKVLIVGDGSDRSSLEERAHQLGMGNRVIFAGYQEQPREFLDVMDVFVLASSGEALPLALIEAMHARLPCVASRVGGTPSVLDEGEAGMLFESGNLGQLEDKLVMLLESSKLRAQFGSAARNRAQEHFSSSRYVQEVQDLWDEVLSS